MAKCPECDKNADTYAAMKSHIINKHKDIPDDQIEQMLNGIGLYKRSDMKQLNNDKEYVKDNKKEVRKMSDDNDDSDELNGLDELEQLKQIIKDNGVKDTKANAIINLFQHYDIDDLKKLQSTLVKAGVNRNSRAMILETWAAQRELPDDEIPSEKSRDDDDDYESQLMRDMGMDDSLKDAMAAAKKKQAELNVARRLKAMGIDPRSYGLPAPPDENKDDDDDKMEFEWPPDSGTTKKMTPERYNSLLYGWNRAHGKIGNTAEEPIKKEKTIPWFDPYNNATIDVPVDQYSNYMAITQQYHREKDMKSSPELDDIKRELREKDEQIKQLIEDSHKRELQDIAQQAQYANQKNAELEKELDAMKNKDPMDSYEAAAKRLREKAALFGLGPQSLSVQEQSLLKKQEVQADTTTTAVQTVAKKFADNKLGTGAIIDKVLTNFQPTLDQALREKIKNSRIRKGSAQPPTDDEINEMYANMEKTEMQEDIGKKKGDKPDTTDNKEDARQNNDDYTDQKQYTPIDTTKYGVKAQRSMPPANKGKKKPK